MTETIWRPTKAQLESARNQTLPDIIRPNVNILFIGINPGLYTAAIARHFGRPGNRFWPSLSASGLLRKPLTAWDSDQLLDNNIGITNLVPRATTLASDEQYPPS